MPHEFNAKVEPLSTFSFNESRSYNLLYFIYAREASIMHLRVRPKIYATVQIHLSSSIPMSPLSSSSSSLPI